MYHNQIFCINVELSCQISSILCEIFIALLLLCYCYIKKEFVKNDTIIFEKNIILSTVKKKIPGKKVTILSQYFCNPRVSLLMLH